MQEKVIRSGPAPLLPPLDELWRFRELCWTLAMRGVLVRYKQTIFGIGWAVLRPVLTALVMTIIFGKIAKLDDGGAIPYLLMVMAGALPFQMFSACLLSASGSVVANAGMVSKIYFPRLMIPVSTCMVAVVDFFFALLVYVVMALWYGVMPPAQAVLFPMFILMGFLAALGPGLWLAAVNVRYRDIMQIVPFLVQILTYLSPVGFSMEKVPERWRLLMSLNPMVSVIDGCRWTLLPGAPAPDVNGVVLSAVVIVLMLLLGFVCFRRMEDQFADII